MQRQPVDMVYDFFRKQVSTKMLFEDKPVFVYQLARAICALTRIRMVFRRGYENISVEVYPPPGLVLVIFFSRLRSFTPAWQVQPQHHFPHVTWRQTYKLGNLD